MGAKGGDFLAGIGSWIGDNKYGSFSEEEQAAQSVGRQALSMIPGYGQLIAGVTGLVDGIGAATGLNINSVDKNAAERAGVKGTGWNSAINHLPGVSMLFGMFGDRTRDDFDISDEARELASEGYTASLKDMEAAESMSNKRLFKKQARQANSYISDMKDTERTLADLNRVNTQRKQSDYYQDLQNQNINRYAGQNYLNFTMGRNGMKLMSIEEARRIVALRKASEESPEKLQNGGNIPGIDTNLIPDGARHKNLNHLDELNSELKDVTKKGIPVTESTDNQQVAEIEVGEIIFRLEVTEQLEQLMKDGSEEAMIEAGKIIAAELIDNTQDNTGQITEENGNTDSDNK